MGGRICYMDRSERGASVRGLRLVGARTDDSWRAPPGEPLGVISGGARWVRDRLASLAESNGRSARVLDRLCLDVDGAACSWISATASDRRMVRAMIEGAAGIGADHAGVDAGTRFPDLPGEVDYEPLGGQGASSRVGVIAMPDVPARLMLDQLDALGVRVGGVMSLWQAMGAAWDSGRPGGGVRGDRVVADERPMTAIVMVDPREGRAVWAWSENGRPIAGGSMRLAGRGVSGESRGRIEDDAVSTLTGEDVSRLGMDWLSWSAQLGRTPSRAICVGPFDRPDESVDGALDAGGVGRALATVWPSASVDVIEEDDPVGRTLRLLCEGDDSVIGGELADLGARPGRSHRSMYVWLAAALALAGIGAGVLAVRLFGAASDIREQQSEIGTNRIELLERVGLPRGQWAQAERELQNTLSDLTRKEAPADPVMPVMTAFDRLTFVLSNPDWDLVELSAGSAAVSARVTVPDIATAEQLEQAVLSVTGGLLEWTPMDKRERAGAVDCSLTGTWSPEARSRSGARP